MTTPTPTDSTSADVCDWLAECGFVSGASGRVYRHPVTGARVVIGRADPLDLTVHAYAGAWRARLTRVPFPVIVATVAAALGRRDGSR